MQKIENLNVAAITPLITPAELKNELPISKIAWRTVSESREEVRAILNRVDPRIMIICGPCSIHDEQSAFEYAERLLALRNELADRFLILMRAYFEKPRTTIGWKGLLNDPYLDGSNNVPEGLRKARKILLHINEMGLPTGSELLDPIVPQYISDLISWSSIGARTTESQTHREMASGFSMPIGFKNSTDGNLKVAIDAMLSAQGQHHFIGINQDGHTSVVQTRGNQDAHIILRGGRGRPNYDPVSVFEAIDQLGQANLPPRIVVDCSHANSGKRHRLQPHVLRDVLQQRLDGNRALIGVMLESNLAEGNQELPDKPEKIQYGVSITDACLSWEATEKLLRSQYEKMAPLFD